MAKSKHKAKLGVHAPVRVLIACRRLLGLSMASRKEVVFEAVAKHLGVDLPPTKKQRYQMCAGLVGGQGTKGVPRKTKAATDVNSDEFLQSYQWRRLRMEVLVERGARCECCGATPQKDGITIHVDHIKPRRLFAELALEKSNLQVLCEVCNHGKGNWNQTDWRANVPQPPAVNIIAGSVHVAVKEQDASIQARYDLRPRLVKRA